MAYFPSTNTNDNVATGNITAADAASSSASGQGGQTVVTGTPTTNSSVALTFPLIAGTAESQSDVVIHITGTFAGTYVFERSPDGGTTWTPFSCFIAGTSDMVSSGTLIGMFQANVSGSTAVRVRQTVRTSGTIAVRITSGISTGTVNVANPLRLYDGVNKNLAVISATGELQVRGSLRVNKVQQATTITSSTSETTVLTAGGSGVSLDVYGVMVANSSNTPVKVTFKDATGGTVRFVIYVPAIDTRGFMLPSSDAYSQSAANNNWTATSSASVASLDITMLAAKN